MEKLKIGITQRTSLRSKQSEVYDSLDQSWTRFLKECGLIPILIPNLIEDFDEYIEEVNLSGFILSGGGEFSNKIEKTKKNIVYNYDANLVSKERDNLEFNIIEYCALKNIPLIGVCRGMQILNYYYGGTLEFINGHIKSYLPLKNLQNEYKFDKFINSYHQKAVLVKTISSEFIPLATTENVIKSFSHNRFRQLGIMWHPERNNPFSLNDIKLFKYFFNNEK